MRQEKKIGILGGTFNPIHNGHLMIAENACKEFQLDEVWLMPAAIPPHKRNIHILEDTHRLAMVSLAAEDVPYFKASDYELKQGQVSYTADTLNALHKSVPDIHFYFIMGADSLRDFETWYHPEIILANADIIAAARDDMNEDTLNSYANRIQQHFHGKINILHVPTLNISSTMIRERAGMKKSVRYFVPDAVAEYIEQHRLYLN